MRNIFVKFLVMVMFLILNNVCAAKIVKYAEFICKLDGFECYKIQKGETWENLFPNHEERQIVQKLNRTNLALSRGMLIAVPQNLGDLNLLSVAPFKNLIDPTGEKTIIVDQKQLAWGAYESSGVLAAWGPISSGQDYCTDIGRGCRTQSGVFRIYRKGGKRVYI